MVSTWTISALSIHSRLIIVQIADNCKLVNITITTIQSYFNHYRVSTHSLIKINIDSDYTIIETFLFNELLSNILIKCCLKIAEI